MQLLGALYSNRWVRWGLTCALLALVIVKADPQRLAGSLSSARPGYLAEALALTIPFLLLKIARWSLMLRRAGVEASFSEAAISLVGGMGLALVTPARLGELVRVAYLRDAQKMKIGGLVLIDKGFDVLVLAGLSVAGAWVLVSPALGIVLAGATLAGLALVYFAGSLHPLLRRIARRLPFGTKVERAVSSLESLSPAASTLFLLLTLASFAVVLVQFGLILQSWQDWRADIIFLTFPLVVLTNVLPITVGGLGIREGTAALLLHHFSVSTAHAALAAFLMFSFNTALPGIVGALLLPQARPRGVNAPNPS